MTTLVHRPRTPLAASLQRLETLVSPLTGIVHDVHELLASPDDARLVRIATANPDTREVIGVDPALLDHGSGGCADERGHARAAAIGEAAERYAAAYVPGHLLVLGSAAESPEAVDPVRFALFAQEQYERTGFPFVPFTREARIHWTPGFALPDERRALLPAQLVYLDWERGMGGEAAVGYSTSSGLACGPTREEAVLAGLLEAIERDAFVLAWANRLSLPLLDWSDDEDLVAWEARYLAPAAGTHVVVDLSVFVGIPAVLAIVHGDGRCEPAVAVGAGCSTTAAGACKKALAEAYSVRTWGRVLLGETPGRRFSPPFADVLVFADHVRLAAAPEYREAAAFLTASPRQRPLADLPPVPHADDVLGQIAFVCERLEQSGCSAYAAELTTPDLADAGLRVTKVVVPELCSLDVRHDGRFLGGERLYRLPFELGLRDQPLTLAEVNPYPHPFP